MIVVGVVRLNLIMVAVVVLIVDAVVVMVIPMVDFCTVLLLMSIMLAIVVV